MRINYVLIDYENLQPAMLSVLEQDHFKVFVFVGASQVKISFEVASAMQRMGSRAQYIRISGNGSNALDFHIAFYLGQLATKEPDAYFHIISKDSGFDPLITHLKAKKIFANRSKDVVDIPAVKVANSQTPSEKVAAIVANLNQRGSSKPRTLKTFSSTISSLFQKSLPAQELSSLLQDLERKGNIIIDGNKVSYPAHRQPNS